MRRLDLGLFIVLMLCAIAVVHTQHRARRLFVDLERERSVAEQLAADLRRLQADQATLAAANRVERAANALHMRQPDPARSVAVSQLPLIASAGTPAAAAQGLPSARVAALAPARLARTPDGGARR